MKVNYSYDIQTEKLRLLCIKQNYYTKGNNEDYYNLFEKVRHGHSIERITEDIFIHSDIDTLCKIFIC